jgi:3-isopropylmalate/(R)-2-methylmalate dehydratase small subunit
MKPIQGHVWKYGDNINTDVIFPGKYTYTITDPVEMRAHALEDLDPGFVAKVQAGDVIVAGKNWGCGSSREQAVTCLKAVGVGAIIAKSVARIYYRNCINAALPVITCPEAVDSARTGDILLVDLQQGKITLRGNIYRFDPIPDAITAVFEAGGLIAYTRQRIQERDTSPTATSD